MKFFALVIIFALITAAGYFLVAPKIPQPAVSPTSSPSTAANALASPSSELVASLRLGGNSFADPKGVFVFLYPNDYVQDSQNNGQYIRIYKIGKTQRGQTEMYDGVNLNFESIALSGKTLEKWVDEHIKSMTADESIEVTQPKKQVTLNGYNGFSYKIRGLGESSYLALQKDANSQFAVSITYMASDPENVGYQKEVDAILSTLELLK